MTLRIAIVGLGVISRYYAAALPQVHDADLAVVYDRRPERCAAYQGTNVAVAASLDEALAFQGLDAVVVNVPNDAHKEVCDAALERGLDVCCEKPLATSVADAEAMVATARRHGRVLFTALHRRCNSNMLRLAKLDRSRIVSVRVRYFEDIREHAGSDTWYLDPKRCGGGCVADNGPNAIDLVRMLLGPVELRSADLRCDGNGIDLQAELELEARDGTAARVELDWAYGDGELKDVTVELDDGSIRHADLLAGYGAFKSSLYHEYVGVLEAFAHAVTAGEERGEAGLDLLRLVADAYRLAGVGAR